MVLKNLIWGNLFSKRKQDTVLSALKKVIIFEDLNSKQLKKIESIGHLRYFKKDEYIFKEGDPSYGLYIVLRGEVDVTQKKKLLQKYRPFDFFGEFALVRDMERTASAKAKIPSTLLYLHEPDLKGIFMEDPKIGFSVYEKMMHILTQLIIKLDKNRR